MKNVIIFTRRGTYDGNVESLSMLNMFIYVAGDRSTSASTRAIDSPSPREKTSSCAAEKSSEQLEARSG